MERHGVDLKEEQILGDGVGSHWYYRAKGAALLRTVAKAPPRRLLDIGAGAGFFSRLLLAETAAESAVCVDTGYPRDWDETAAGKPLSFRRRVDRSNADLVLLMDVLEHVDSEPELLQPYVDAVPSGTRFFVSVPAFMFLWSGHDVFLEHRRRYVRRALVDTGVRCGLQPVASHYYYAAVFPLAAATRLWQRLWRRDAQPAQSQLRRHGPAVNAVLAGLCAAERPLMRFNRLAGLSVFAQFRKP